MGYTRRRAESFNLAPLQTGSCVNNNMRTQTVSVRIAPAGYAACMWSPDQADRRSYLQGVCVNEIVHI